MADLQHGSRSVAGREIVAIIGFGNYGRALAHRFEACGIEFCIGTRDINRELCRTSTFNIKTYETAVKLASIIILAVPSHAYGDFSDEMREELKNKIVVDVSNVTSLQDSCNAERLAALLSDSFVVKAFNTLSAWSMQSDICGASRETYVCGDNTKARHAVMQLAQDMGLTPVDSGRLSAARLLEKKQLKIFPEWRFAFLMTVFLLILTTGYIYMRVFLYISGRNIAVYAVMPIGNAVAGCMVLLLLTVVFLPGVIASITQLTRGTKYGVLPAWLRLWMKSRKQFGLFALLFAALHACMSLVLLSGEYYPLMSRVSVVNGTLIYHKYRWNTEISLLFATLSISVLSIQCLASLPSVNQSMSWKEWDFIQSRLGYTGFFFGFLHVAFYAGIVFLPDSMKRWKYGIPHQLFLLSIFAAVVMLLKLFLLLPGVNSMLEKIKAGWERKKEANECQLLLQN